MNNVTLTGRICNNLELKTSGETKFVNFLVAVDRQKKGEADFLPVTCFNKQAENLCKYQKKGSKLAIIGNIRSESYNDQEGNKRTSIKVVAQNIEYLDAVAKDSSEAVRDDEYNTYKAKATEPNLEPIDDEDIPF